MRVLLIGSGGREHSLGWRLVSSGHEVISAPGNPGLAALGRVIPVGVNEIDGLVAVGLECAPDLVVIGPEGPLVAGLADKLRAVGLAVFGPGADGAVLEGSKVTGKQFFARHGVRTAPFVVCEGRDAARSAVAELGGAVVVKLDGLAAGKGVIVCRDSDAGLLAIDELRDRFGIAAETLLVERCIRGRELSVMALCDGKRFVRLAEAEDHKQLRDGDEGPNTGGMGTVSPPRWVTDELLARVDEEIFEPTIEGLAADRIDFRGVLYAGLMVDGDGAPWILEYNCRFGDPETQPVMMRLRGDLGAALLAAANGDMRGARLDWDPRSCVCVVMASAGYPEGAETGVPIRGLDEVEGADTVVFHAGTAMRGSEIVSAGGRVLGVTALGASLNEARAAAYDAVAKIELSGAQYRRDIGAREGARRPS